MHAAYVLERSLLCGAGSLNQPPSAPDLWRYEMKHQPNGQLAEPASRQCDTPASKQQSSRCGPFRAALAVSLSLLCGTVAADQGDRSDHGSSPIQLRRFIDAQVGGIEKLMVPANDADLPQPRLANGSPDPAFQTTEAKRYLGKQLFHDPIRTARILPEFGGVLATKQTASCGSCHQGESAAKGEATRTPRGPSFRAGGPVSTSFRSCATPLSSPVTRWWTKSPRSRTSTSSRWAVQPAVASYRTRVSCCEPVDSTPWTASRAMRQAQSEPPSTTAS